MEVDPETDLNSGWSSEEQLNDGSASSDGGKPTDIVLDHDNIGVPSHGKYSYLPSVWPLPVAGLTYLLHLRYRRCSPRRLPRITPLRPFELYATAGLVGSVFVEKQRFFENLKRDRDLLVLEYFAIALREVWIEYQARWKEMEHLQTEMWRFGFYPAVGQLSERLGWIHNHWWTSPVAWNFAMISLAPGSTEVSRHDMDVCITHIANTLETGGGILWIDRALPFGLAFLGLAPFGMWVRFLRVGSCYLSLPMNGIQRILFYLMAYLSVGSQYQHLRYPTTLHDKHSVANMLCTVHPRLEGAVEHVRRKFELGGEDGT
ncbi:hypothetical protein LXA43DRAFT_101882 [Ganoderma leucocontextum]|nr:hypothetical protein LXA43DRAFT_101882 [Ganoderma leucocontextum]